MLTAFSTITVPLHVATVSRLVMDVINVVIVDHDHKVSRKGVKSDLVSAPIVIGNSVWIGANVTILKGVNIGEGAVIAANSVVRNDVAPHSLAEGVPARFIKEIV